VANDATDLHANGRVRAGQWGGERGGHSDSVNMTKKRCKAKGEKDVLWYQRVREKTEYEEDHRFVLY